MVRGNLARRVMADMLREEFQTDGAQTSALSDIFDREPMPLAHFITDQLHQKINLSELQFDFLHHLERIFLPATYIAMVEQFGEEWMPVRDVHMMTLMWGKGSGKDSMCRLGVMRVADLINSLSSPQDYYGLPEQDDIHLLNVASSTDQARRAFFSPMRRMFTTNAHMMSMLRGEPPGEMATSIRLKKNVELISGNSDADTQEGLNLLVGIADEISAFKTVDELARAGVSEEGRSKKTAEGIVKMLRTSARSRFPESFKVVQISYPRFKGDAIMQAAARARQERTRAENENRISTHYLSGPWATWEVNPRVTKDHFSDDYEDDPVMAATMYECRPSSSVNRYMRDDYRISEAFRRNITEPIQVEYYWGLPDNKIENKLMPDEQPGWQVRFHFNDQVLRPMMGARYALHGDMAQVQDRAGVAMSHVRTYKSFQVNADRPAERRPVVRNDFVLSFEADLSASAPDGSHAPREIQLRWYRQLIWELRARRYKIASVTFDGWQSTDMIQQLKARGIESRVRSVDRPSGGVYQTFKEALYDGRVDGYYRNRLVEEIKALTLFPNGKIDHPPGGCFTYETRIPLLDGSCPQIGELEGSRVWVYSATPDGKIVPGFAKARKTKMTRQLVDVTLDSGYTARCTPEHLWMLRDGSYKEAQHLVPGVDRLMPIRRTWPVNGGYERVTDKDGVRTLTHHLVSNHFAGADEVPAGMHVHHVDEDKINNVPENLVRMTHEEHVTYHSADRWAAKQAAMRSGYDAWNGSVEQAEMYARRRNTNWTEGLTPEERSKVYAERWSLYRGDITIDLLRSVAQDHDNANAAARALGCGRNVVTARLRAAGYETWVEFRAMCDSNHKVRYIEHIELAEPVPVYDLEVDEWHNFALAGGVFVHNSKDEADALAGSVFGALQVGGSEGDTPTEVDEDAMSLTVAAAPGRAPVGFGGFGGGGMDFGEVGALGFGSNPTLGFG